MSLRWSRTSGREVWASLPPFLRRLIVLERLIFSVLHFAHKSRATNQDAHNLVRNSLSLGYVRHVWLLQPWIHSNVPMLITEWRPEVSAKKSVIDALVHPGRRAWRQLLLSLPGWLILRAWTHLNKRAMLPLYHLYTEVNYPYVQAAC
jgi:hypothetical protein